jgi:hypothetical protein
LQHEVIEEHEENVLGQDEQDLSFFLGATAPPREDFPFATFVAFVVKMNSAVS